MSHMRRSVSFSALVLCLLVFAGCGGSKKGPTIKGTVVLPPNVKLAENDSATITFAGSGEGTKQFATPINVADLTFQASGPTGKGVIPGEYKIAVRLQPYAGGKSQHKPACDAINDKYSSGNSNLSYKVTEDPEQSITVDLTKGTVTKK